MVLNTSYLNFLLHDGKLILVPNMFLCRYSTSLCWQSLPGPWTLILASDSDALVVIDLIPPLPLSSLPTSVKEKRKPCGDEYGEEEVKA